MFKNSFSFKEQKSQNMNNLLDGEEQCAMNQLHRNSQLPIYLTGFLSNSSKLKAHSSKNVYSFVVKF